MLMPVFDSLLEQLNDQIFLIILIIVILSIILMTHVAGSHRWQRFIFLSAQLQLEWSKIKLILINYLHFIPVINRCRDIFGSSTT